MHLVTIMGLNLFVSLTFQVPESEQELFTNSFLYGSKIRNNTEIKELLQWTTEVYTKISCKDINLA